VFNAVKRELKELSTNSQILGGLVELYDLISRITMYLRISQLFLLVRGFFAYIHKYIRILGLVVLISGLVVLVVSTIRAHSRLGDVRKYL